MKANIQKKAEQVPNFPLVNIIVDSILEKKGHEIISLDLSNLEDAVADYFIICEGNSGPQIRAIADNIAVQVKKLTGEHPTYKEGLDSLEWALLDYVDVIVHIFHKSKRNLYRLEELWGDAAITTQYFEDGSHQTINNRPTNLSKAK